MAQRIDIPLGLVPPGSYAHEILAPARSNAAKITMTRQPVEWPVGELFTYRVFDRERNSGVVNLMTSGTEYGGLRIGRDGTVNPTFSRAFIWREDKDRDLIRIELTVVQTFTTAITIEFL